MLNGLGAQLGAWEKFEDPKAGVISYFHKAFYKTFIDSGMKDFAVEVIKKYPGFRVWYYWKFTLHRSLQMGSVDERLADLCDGMEVSKK
ncbi:hypothetical protein RB195_024041 [Necator americanus]|uniref:Uncharacterized protein n=1 Tax=Necator americanus TaxID=51031 RepID=A0ABR1ELN8_NECAM